MHLYISIDLFTLAILPTEAFSSYQLRYLLIQAPGSNYILSNQNQCNASLHMMDLNSTRTYEYV